MSTKTEYLGSRGEYFHLYNRGVNHGKIFHCKDNYAFFLGRMEKFRGPGLHIVAYCLMPTHFHFLVRQDEPGAISDFIALISKSYALALNKYLNRTGHLFGGKYKLKHVDDEDYLQHVSRYIHLNPVRAHLVRRPEDWPYSSCREYYGLRESRLVFMDPILAEFRDAQTYRKFIQAYVPEDKERISEYLVEE